MAARTVAVGIDGQKTAMLRKKRNKQEIGVDAHSRPPDQFGYMLPGKNFETVLRNGQQDANTLPPIVTQFTPL